MNEEQYRELWRQAVETEERVAHSFDRWMLTLSGGALGLSITFIQQNAPNPVCVGLLHCAWAAFLFAVVAMLASLLTSQRAQRRFREILDSRLAQGDGSGDECNLSGHVTNVLNWVSLVCFILGVVMMAAFCGQNLS